MVDSIYSWHTISRHTDTHFVVIGVYLSIYCCIYGRVYSKHY